MDGGQDGIGARRGEHIAGDRRRQHAGAHVAGMRRLVPAAAAGDQRHRPRLGIGAGDVGPHDDGRVRQQRQPRGQGDETLQHLAHDAGGLVDQFLHACVRSECLK